MDVAIHSPLADQWPAATDFDVRMQVAAAPTPPPYQMTSVRDQYGNWVAPQPPPPQGPPYPGPPPFPGHYTPQVAACFACGGAVVPMSHDIRRRRQMGLGWLMAIVFSCGLALPLYLFWRHSGEIVGVDRFNQCMNCGAQQ